MLLVLLTESRKVTAGADALYTWKALLIEAGERDGEIEELVCVGDDKLELFHGSILIRQLNNVQDNKELALTSVNYFLFLPD